MSAHCKSTYPGSATLRGRAIRCELAAGHPGQHGHSFAARYWDTPEARCGRTDLHGAHAYPRTEDALSGFCVGNRGPFVVAQGRRAMIAYRARESGSTYSVIDRSVIVAHIGLTPAWRVPWGPCAWTLMTFPSSREAISYASLHGRRVTR